MPATTFYTGIWGDYTPTVPGDEDACNAMLRNGGQTIRFSSHNITVFTEGADARDSGNQSEAIYDVLAGRSQREVKSLISLSKQIDKFSRKYQGKRYIVYVSDRRDGRPRRHGLYHGNRMVSNIINVVIGYCKDTAIIRRAGFTSEMITTSEADIYSSRIEILIIVTGEYRTHIIVHNDELAHKKVREIIYVSRNPKKRDEIQERLTKLAGNNNTMYIYSTNRGLLPHVYPYHLELMRDYIINSQQADIFLAAQYQPASEDQIRYGDDDNDDVPIRTNSPHATFAAEARIRYDDDAYEDD